MTPFEKAMAWGMVDIHLKAAKKSAEKQDFVATFDNVTKVLEELKRIGPAK